MRMDDAAMVAAAWQSRHGHSLQSALGAAPDNQVNGSKLFGSCPALPSAGNSNPVKKLVAKL